MTQAKKPTVRRKLDLDEVVQVMRQRGYSCTREQGRLVVDEVRVPLTLTGGVAVLGAVRNEGNSRWPILPARSWKAWHPSLFDAVEDYVALTRRSRRAEQERSSANREAQPVLRHLAALGLEARFRPYDQNIELVLPVEDAKAVADVIETAALTFCRCEVSVEDEELN